MIRQANSEECAIIIGSYTNACSIIKGLKDIRYDHRILAIDPTVDDAKCLSEIVFPEIPVFKKKIIKLEEIVDLINDKVEDEVNKTVFMTSEEFIEPIRNAIENKQLKNTIAHTGSAIDNEIIFDRFRFYRFVEQLNIINIPKTITSDEDPVEAFGDSFIIRVKKSWEGNRKLPRLQIVHSLDEKELVEKRFFETGLSRDMWCYQELLSTVDTNNVSVCGWYDDQFKQFAVTRKILQHPPKTGNGDVVEIYHGAPEIILEQTEKILKALQYCGAFEMEFVLDANSREYKIIELNPRFWMQHGLIEKVTNNALIRRALGQENINEIPESQLPAMYWLNGTQAIYRLIKGQVVIFKYLNNGFCVPTVMQAVKWANYYRKYVNESNVG